jgi:hypothetical protein
MEMKTQGEGWGASFMAGLPHLLIGVIIVSTEVVYQLSRMTQNVFSIFFVAIFSLFLIGVVIYNRSKGWKSWAASWIVYMFIMAILILSQVANAIPHSIIKNNAWVSEAQTLILPLVLAYLLYKIACKDRLWGLLAAVVPMAMFWFLFLEFVPTLQKAMAWMWIMFLAFIATVLMLRTKRFSTALLLAMAVPVLGGFPFTYLGVYMGGSLPFSEPGPSLQVVFRQYLPFVVMILTLVLGPQLGVRLRIAGHHCAQAGGKIFYRLALGGILVGLFYGCLKAVDKLSGFSSSLIVEEVLIVSAIALYLVGYGLLTRATLKSRPPSGDNSGLLELAGLFFPLLILPVILIVGIQFTTVSWLVPIAEIAWVIATTLVVKD